MLETHPFPPFIPPHARYLLLGSFIARKFGQSSYDWYYSNGRNQFWNILEAVYHCELDTISLRKELFIKLSLGVTDLIYQCDRKLQNSADTSLVNCTYNTRAIEDVFKLNSLKKVYFTSKFVERTFKKVFKHLVTDFPDVEFVALPSPSPRYAAMSKTQKAIKYSRLLPQL